MSEIYITTVCRCAFVLHGTQKHVKVCVCIYIYIYICRERERERSNLVRRRRELRLGDRSSHLMHQRDRERFGLAVLPVWAGNGGGKYSEKDGMCV